MALAICPHGQSWPSAWQSLIALWRIDADQAHPLARNLERVAVEHAGNAADGLAFACRRSHADAGQALVENVADAAAPDAVDLRQCPHPRPRATLDDLAGPLGVDMDDGGKLVLGIGVDIDALGSGSAGAANASNTNNAANSRRPIGHLSREQP